MASKRFSQKVLEILRMPDEDTEDAVEVGQFCPGDSPEVVRQLSRLRVEQITKLSRLDLHPANAAFVQSLAFHTYEDFLLTLKHATPKKGDSISPGHSLDGFEPNLAGYLAYLAEKAPDLARFFFAKLNVRIPESDRRRHTYIVGKSGSGKSELLKLLLYSYTRRLGFCTTILVDPHGDIADEVSRFKENRTTDRLVLVDPYLDKFGKRKPCINPFDIRDRSPQNVDIVAQALLGAFKELLQNTSLTTQMEALLVPCLTVLLHREGSTLLDLQRFMNDEKNDDLVELGTQSEIKTHRIFFKDRFYERTFTVTKASISTKLQSILNSETFYHLTVGKSTLDIEEALNSRKLVVFNLSKGRLGSDTSEAFGRFIIALVQSAILKRASQQKGERVPVHMFIDEFQNYVSESMKEVLAESRKYGLHLTLAQQYVGQEMDTAFKDAILTNTQIKMTGLGSNKTVSPIAKEMGLDESEILRLGVGSFFVKVGNRPTYRMYAPTFLLGNRNAMTWEEWHGVREHQLAEYYRNTAKGGGGLGQSETEQDTGDVRGSDTDEYLNEEEGEPKPKKPIKPKYTF
jgi:hypothetical protein